MGCFGKRRHKKKENKYQRPAAPGGAYPTNKAYRSGAGKGDYSSNKDGGMVIMTNMIAGTAAATDSCGSTCGGGSSACDGGGGGGGCGGGGCGGGRGC
ncbi:hypothetical protein MANES_08G086533v8 [Manihot esculenta]|uniref:Uncharacterized protein n=1 Tax=Manihot esculenta TaxID=3983 RepID=A0A2C9VEL7_MANES|nr:hypothetical protein MANES_08G086533v8 [Manihot esculenta]